MKKILLLFTVLFSFSANSETVLVGSVLTPVVGCPVSTGSVYDTNVVISCSVGSYWANSTGKKFFIKSGNYGAGKVNIEYESSNSLKITTWFTASAASCELPSVINPDTGACEEASKPECKAGDIVGPRSWPWSSSGSTPSLCLQSCSYRVHGTSACLVATDKCVGKFISTEGSCSDNGLSSGGGYPEPPPGGCIWTGPEDDRVLTCNGDGDGDGKPDPDTPVDPDAECSWDGDTLVCNGGTFPPDTGGGDGGDTGGGGGDGGGTGGGGSGGDDGVDPVPPTADLTGVIKAVRDFNSDNNANLERLNNTNTTGFDKVVDTNTTGFGDVVTAIDGLQVGGNGVDLTNIEGSLTSIEGGINAITGTDTSGSNFSDCYSTDTCTSLYESEYSEYKDLSELVSEKMGAISNGVIKQVTDIFTNIDISNAEKPNTNACLDFGFVNFGCFDFFQDLSWIWSFVRFCFIFTAIMTARKLVFGG